MPAKYRRFIIALLVVPLLFLLAARYQIASRDHPPPVPASPAAPVTPEVLERGYARTRARFDAMAERFRAHLRRPGPFLYVQVCDDVPSEWDVEALVEALRARAPEHRFRLLFVATEGSDTPWGDYASTLADKAFRPRKWSKPEGREWEGPDAAWDAALAPYRLAFPDGSPA